MLFINSKKSGNVKFNFEIVYYSRYCPKHDFLTDFYILMNFNENYL